MRPLSKIEKEEHSTALKEFVFMINQHIIPHKGKIELAEVGYGIPVDDEYFYFDYPYNDTVDKFNEDLANPEVLGGIDVKIHSLFHSVQQKKENGFIHYQYDIRDNTFLMYGNQNNLGLKSEDDCLQKFLPIMHCAVTNETNYLLKVIESPPKAQYKQLLILSRRLGKGTDGIVGKNVLVCAFKIEDCNLGVTPLFINELYDKVVNLLETYFNSPVLGKILEDRKRSEVLTYEHSLYNLRIDATLAHLQKKIKFAKYDDLLDISRELEQRVNVLHLNLYGLFYASKKAAPDETYPLFGKSIVEIMEYFTDDLNFDRINVVVENEGDLTQLNLIPSIDKLFDIQIVLWNLWKNACVSSADIDKSIWLKFSNRKGVLSVSLKNTNEMPIEFVKYLHEKDVTYPGERDDDRPYRGLQIIKDKIKDNNWQIEVSIDKQLESMCYTNITLSMKNI